MSLVRMPKLGANDEHATLVQWFVADGAATVAGRPLCLVETTKSAVEVDAPAAGIVAHAAAAGSQVAVGAPIAAIAADHTAARAELPIATAAPAARSAGPVRATRRAEALAKELGIDLASVAADGLVTEDDVRAAARATAAMTEAPETVAPIADDEPGRIDPAFLARIARDPAFATLPGPEKLEQFRRHGAVIGADCVLAPGVAIAAKVLRLGDGVVINRDCQFQCDRLVIGPLSALGARLRAATREVVLGDVFFCGEDVLIGGGGAWGGRSLLRTGHSCFVGSRCILNTSEPVVLGDEVGLSPGVELFTHSHWQNVLDGYQARSAPIHVGNHAYVAGGSLIAPGVRVGRGAQVWGRSLVVSDVPERTAVAGVPAQSTGTIAVPDAAQRRRIAQRLLGELREHLAVAGFDPAQLALVETWKPGDAAGARAVLAFASDAPPAGGPVVFDLEKLRVLGTQDRYSDEVRHALRRRGVRFEPRLWAYRHDVGKVVG